MTIIALMKKFVLFLSCVFIIAGGALGGIDFTAVGADDPASVHTFYISNANSLPRLDYQDSKIKVTINGYWAHLSCPGEIAGDIKPKLKDISGESVTFRASLNKVAAIIEKYQVTDFETQYGSNFYTVYGYSPKLNEYAVNLDGNTINIQIAYRDGVVTVGTPVILGSY